MEYLFLKFHVHRLATAMMHCLQTVSLKKTSAFIMKPVLRLDKAQLVRHLSLKTEEVTFRYNWDYDMRIPGQQYLIILYSKLILYIDTCCFVCLFVCYFCVICQCFLQVFVDINSTCILNEYFKVNLWKEVTDILATK